jgi:two-component system sensor histidine kinase/response regulator
MEESTLELNHTSTILIADDDPGIRQALEALLTDVGYRVACASNGAQALTKAKELSPDLILLDVKMPDMDGFVVCRRLRTDPLLAEVPIIMVTALADRDSRLQGFEAGADDYVSKPIDGVELLARVRTTTRLNRYRRLLLEQTRRIQAEEALLESEERFHTLARVSPVGVFCTDAEGHCLYVNGRWCEIADLTLEEALGEGWAQGLHPDDREHVLTEWYRAAKENRPFELEYRFQRSDGATTWVFGQAVAEKGDMGEIIGYVETVTDITKRRRAEEALRHRNEELAALNAIASAMSRSLGLEEMLNAVLKETLAVLSVEGGLIYLFDETSQTFAPAVHLGMSPAILQEVTGFKTGQGLSGRAAETGQPLFVSDLADDPRNISLTAVKEGWRSLVSVPLITKDKTVGVMTIVSRVGGRFSSESVDMLTAIGHQVGVAIENVQLAAEAAEADILQELDRLRSELIANVSHELRTPLGLIKVFCTTLLREDVEFDRETRREFLRDIDEETDRLERIVDNLLDLSRLESGRLRLNKRPTDIGQLAGEVVEAMSLDIQPVQHQLVCDFPSDPLVALVDPQHVEQVLRNLLSNATKYSPDGGIITVGGRGDERQLLIWVRDQGIGIPHGDLERVFERFYRAENEATRQVRGAGLGLAVCRGIVEAHGGRIWAESTPGTGSTFYFALPVGDE